MHASVLDDELREFLYNLNKDKMTIWKQMRCLEILAAVIAEKLMDQGTKILIDPDEIVWPDKTVTRPPSKGQLKKLKKNGKNQDKTKHGVFGDIVHKYKNASSVNTQVDAVEINETPQNISKRGRPRKAAAATKKAPAKRSAKSKQTASKDDSGSDDDEENGKVDISKIWCFVVTSCFVAIVCFTFDIDYYLNIQNGYLMRRLIC